MSKSPHQKRRPAILATSVAALLSVGLLLGVPSVRADEYWDGTNTTGAPPPGTGGTGTWDNATTNWSDASGNPITYDPGQTAHFANTGGVVTLGDFITFSALSFEAAGYSIEPSSSFTLTPTGMATITVQGGISVTIDAPVTGSGGVDYEGGGTVIVTSTSNNYTGGTNIGGGTTLSISSDSNLGDPSGGLSFDGGTLQATASFATNRTITLNGSGGTFSPTTGIDLEIDGAIGGSGELTVAGGGTVTLTNAGNSYSGGTDIGVGTTLSIQADTNLGATSGGVTFDGGTLVTTADVTTSRNFTINAGGGTFAPASGTVEIDGAIGGAGELIVGGSGVVLLTNTSNAYLGGTDILSGATLTISSDSNLGDPSGGVTFDGGTLETAASSSVTLGAGRTVTVNSTGGILSASVGTTLEIDGMISGAGKLTATGGGTVTLTNAGNNYLGGTDIGSGTTLSISSDSNLGDPSGGVTFDGGTLEATSSVTLGSTRAITVNVGGGTLSPDFGINLEVDGVISGNGQVIAGGAGTVVLTNTGNTYQGGTGIADGATLSISSDANLGNTAGAVNIDGGTLLVTANVTLASTRGIVLSPNGAILAPDPGDTLTVPGVISDTSSGAGKLTVAGGGTVVLTNTANTYQGGTDIGSSTTLSIASDGSLGAAGAPVTFDGGTLQTTANITTSRPITLDTPADTVSPNAGTTLDLEGAIGGAGALTMAGNGTLALGGANSYAGATTISTGTLQTNAANTIPSTSAVLVNTGTTLVLNGHSQNVGSIADGGGGGGAINLGSATLTTGNDNTTTGFSGTISGTGGGLTKVGTGTLTLSGANTYTGATTSNGGALVIAPTTTATPVLSAASALVVGGGTFQLNGLAGQNITQTLNGLTVNKGSSEIIVNNLGTTTTLDLSGSSGLMGITHNAGGFVDFEASSGTFGVNAIVKTNQANDSSGIIGGWATVNGGTALAANQGGIIVAYTGYTDINALGPNKVPNDPTANVRINALGTSGPDPIADPTTDINTLTQNFSTASTIDTSPGTLRLGTTGGVFITPGGASLTIGTVPNSGILTAGGDVTNQAGDLGFENDSTTAGTLLTVNSVIANNGTGVVSVSVGGTGTTVFGGTNTYGGSTTVASGTLQLDATQAIPSTSAVVVNANATLNLNNFSQSVVSISDGAQGGGTINLGTGTLTTGSSNANSAFSGLVEGAGSVVKLGTGTLVLSNSANSYSGGTTLGSGTLVANGSPVDGSGTPLGTGTLTIKGGTLATTILPTSGSTGTDLTNPISLLGNFSIAPNSDPSNPGAQNITLTGQINLNGATRTITGIINEGQVHFGTGGIGTAGETAGLTLNTPFTKSGDYVAFIMDPGNVNQYTGLTTVNNGAFLVFEGSTAGGSIHGNVDIEGNGVVDYLGGAAQQLQPTTVVTDNSTGNVAGGIYFGGLDLFQSTGDTIAALNGHGTVTLASGILTIGAGNFSGEIGDGDHSGFSGGGITKISAGTLILSGATSYTGTTTISAGTLEAGADFATSSSSAFVISSGATFDVDGHTEQVGSISDGAGSGTISLGSGSLVAGFNDTSTTFSGVIQDGGISKGKGGGLIKVGTGTLTLSGTANTYTGESYVFAGTLQAGAANTIPSKSAVLVNQGATFDLNNFAQTVGSISDGGSGGGTISLGSAVLTAGGDGLTTAFSGVIQDGGAGGSFVKTGRGTLFLDGANTYIGATTVNGGVLDLGGSVTSQVTVNSGASLVLESAGFVTPSNATATPVTLTTNADFHNFGNLTDASAVIGTDLTGVGNTVNNGVGAVISAITGIMVTNPVGVTTIVNYGTVTGTGGKAIDAHNSSDLTYGDFGTINGTVTLSPTKNTVLLATGFAVNALAGPTGANNTLRLTGGSTGNVDLDSFPNYQALQKVGAGVWTVNGTGMFTEGTSVMAGTLNVAGNLISNVTIQGAGMVSGTGTVSGNLNNFGTVNPGTAVGVVNPVSAPGTLTLKGSYRQASSGALVIQVNGTQTGQYSVLSIGGSAQLSGTLDLQSQGKTPRFKVGQKLEILTADGGLSGRFSTIINATASDTVITDRVVYEGNSVVLEGTQGSFASIRNRLALTPNQTAVATMLDTASSDQRNAKLISYLDGRSIPDLQGDFDRIAPEEIASVFRIGTSLADVQTRNIQRRTSDLREGTSGFSAAGFQTTGNTPGYSGGLAGPNGSDNGSDGQPVTAKAPDRRLGFFLTGAGDFVHVGSTDNARGYDLNTGGLTLGVDYKLTPEIAVGLSAGYAGTDSRLDNDGRIQVNGGKLGVYGTYYTGGFYTDLTAGGGISGYDIRRGALQGDARGYTQGSDIDAVIDTGYDWRLDALTIGPTASFQYTYMGVDGFTETGSLAPLRYGSQHGQSARSTIGFKASYDWKLGGVLVRPEIHIDWQHEFADRAFPIDASLASGAGSLFSVTDSEIGRDGLLLGGGVAVLWNPRTSAYLFYDADLLQKEYSEQSVTGGVKVNF